MKLVKHKTDKIIVKATCKDEEMSCDFAILKIDETLLWEIYGRVKSIYEKEDGYSYYTLCCPFYTTFYNVEDEGDFQDIDLSLVDKEWSYIEITDKEELQLQEVEDGIELLRLNVCQDGDFHITCSGKYSGVEFSTSMINIEDL